MISNPVLVAHRGYPARYPENTLPGIEAALRCGAGAIEFDVQLTADRVPVLFHDDDLERVTGAKGSILQITRAELGTLSACEPGRFGRRYAGTAVATLDHAADLLARHPGVEVFVEIKRHSLKRFGIRYTTERILRELGPIERRCIATSFDPVALAYIRDITRMRIAWVMDEFDASSRHMARTLKPDILVCDIKKLPDADNVLWPDAWNWMLYFTDERSCARKWHRRGAQYIETNDIGGMQAKG